MTTPVKLKRSIGLPMLVFYGVGTMVGGGFYALLGEVADEAALAAPCALLLAGVLALMTALCYGELAARFPVAAGEAAYVRGGFNRIGLATAVGIAVIATGVVSSATLCVAAVGFVQDMAALPEWIGIVVIVAVMAFVAAWGVGESVALVAVITVIEVGALLFAGAVALPDVSAPESFADLVPLSGAQVGGVLGAMFLAFYAFIGFEDMVNMAEEVRDPKRVLPRGILISLAVTTLIYVVVSLIAVLSVGPAQLAASQTPVAELVRGSGWFSTTGLQVVSILAGVNGALVQIVMASRVCYGLMSRRAPESLLARVHPTRRTPVNATILMSSVILVLALFLPVATLAKITAGIILGVFAVVNLALWRIKGHQPQAPGRALPRWLPLIAAIACFGFLIVQVVRALLPAG